MKLSATPGIQQSLNPEQWKEHCFGIPLPRWRSLAGKSYWITGAGTGYGQAISLALAAADVAVYMTGRRESKLLETRDRARSLGIDATRLTVLPADITDQNSVSEAANRIAGACTGLHGFVNSAALPSPGSLASINLSEWKRLWDTNVTGAWLLARAALPLLELQGSSRVVLITSEAGWASTPGFGAYNASKAALNSLGTSLAAEFAQRQQGGDSQVNILIPGEAHTEMNKNSKDSPYAVVCMTLLLLSHPRGGPNGHFFHRDGRHFGFGYSNPYGYSLLDQDVPVKTTNQKKLSRILTDRIKSKYFLSGR